MDITIPTFFSEKDKILNFDYSKIKGFIGSSIDHSTTINNLSPGNKDILLIDYFKSILLGYNHVYILKILNLLMICVLSVLISTACSYKPYSFLI